MIEEKEVLTGSIAEKQVLTGELDRIIEVVEPVTQEKEVTPTKQTQNVQPDEGYNGLSQVTVNPIPNEYIIPSGNINITDGDLTDVTQYAAAQVVDENLTPANIKKNVTILGTTGTYEGTNQKFRFLNYGGVSFYRCPEASLQNEIDNVTQNIDTSTITTMDEMFYQCNNITSLDMSGFNVSNVKQFASTFNGCNNLTSLNLSGWDTSNATTMANMFNSCSSLTTLDLSSFRTLRVTNTTGMFTLCTSLTHIDMRNCVFVNVTSYNNMFGSSATVGVPNNCEILVQNNTAKTWITSKFPRLTNVKVV